MVQSVRYTLACAALLVAQLCAGGMAGAQTPPAGGADSVTARFFARNMPPLPPGAPKPPAGPRNFQGVWYHREMLEFFISKTMYGKPIPLKPEGQAILDHRRASTKAGRPIANASTRCIPPGQTWQLDLNFPFSVLYDHDTIYFVFEEFHGIWKIRMNQPHRTDGVRDYMGDSVGRWDGDTLVVDTVGFKAPFWLDVAGTPATKNVHIVQRIRKIDEDGGPALSVITTIDDPALYSAPWSVARSFAWRPDKMIFDEYNCEEQVGGEDGVARYGVIEEKE